MDLYTSRQECLSDLYRSGFQSDVIFRTSAGQQKAQGTLLAALSPFWNKLLREHLQFCEQSHLQVILPDLEQESVGQVLELAFTGQTYLEQSNFEETLCAPLQLLLPDVRVQPPVKVPSQGHWEVSLTLSSKEDDDLNNIEAIEKLSEKDPTSHPRMTLEKIMDSNEEEEEQKRDPALLIEPVKKSARQEQNKENSSHGHGCPQCPRSFRYAKDLAKHALVHSGSLPFGCAVCKKYFRNKSNLYKHLRENHRIEDVKKHILTPGGQSEMEEKSKLAKGIDPHKVLGEVLRQAAVESGSGAKAFQCPICQKKFATKISVTTHINVHANVKPFNCEKCDKSFFSSTGLNKHLDQKHSDKDKEAEKRKHSASPCFRCSFCSDTYNSDDSRTEHVNRVHRDKLRFECHICNKRFSMKANILVHQKNIHKLQVDKDYSCRICHLKFNGKVQLGKHKMAAHKGEADELCSICGKSFVTLEQLLRHEAIHTKRERLLKCNFCPKAFFRRDVLKLHEKIHTDPISCRICVRKFPHARSLEAHVKTVHGSDLNPCQLCDKHFSSLDKLKEHENAEHANEIETKQPQCEATSQNESALNSHVTSMHNSRNSARNNFRCQHCDFSTARSIYSLKRHLVKHKCPLITENKSCPDCEKEPGTSNQLKKHVELHNRQKTIPCDECDQKFRTQHELLSHSHIHVGAKPFSFDHCPEKFARKPTLQQHLQRRQTDPKSETNSGMNSMKTLTTWQSRQKAHESASVSSKALPILSSKKLGADVLPALEPVTLTVPDALVEGEGFGSDGLVTVQAPGVVVDERLTYRIQIVNSNAPL